MNEELALHGETVATASSNIKIGKWSISATQAYIQDNIFLSGRNGRRLSLRDLQQKARRGFQDTSVSAQRSFKVGKRLQLDLTMSSSVPMGGPFGTHRMDNSADAMIEGTVGSKMFYWAGVTQHMRTGGAPQTREYLTEYYGGFSRNLSKLTSLRWNVYRAQGQDLQARPTTSMSMSLNHELPELGSVKISALRLKDEWSDDERASVSLKLDKLPF